jgi:PAS domain S-box-containing protein
VLAAQPDHDHHYLRRSLNHPHTLLVMESKKEFHKLLQRQIQKHFPDLVNQESAFKSFFEAVSQSYFQHDNDRLFLEHAMLQSSQELLSKKQVISNLLDTQTKALDSLRISIAELLPQYDPTANDDIMAIADILHNEVHGRKIAEQTNVQINKRISYLLNSLKLGMVEYDLNGVIQFAHEKFYDIFEWPEGELQGKGINALINETKEQDYLSKFLGSFTSSDGLVLELPLFTYGKRPFWALCSIAPVFDYDGKRNGMVMVVFDITDQKNLESELRSERSKAEEALEIRKSIMANVSHELRTPLNAIVGMSSLLRDTPLNPEQSEYVDTLKNSSHGLLILINDLLDVSKIESGALVLENTTFSLHQSIHLLRKGLNVKAQEKGIKLRLISDSDLHGYHLGDPTRLNQVITNLVGNAIKFTSEGTVDIILDLVEDRKTEQVMRIAIKDTGIGIPEDRISGIFMKFSQADASTTRKYGGTGLGLNIANEIVNLMGGEIIVKSKVGEGSEFMFTITLAKAEAPQVDEPNVVQNKSLQGYHILLVDDNNINLFLAQTILSKWHAEVTTATNGEEAIQAITKGNFDLVLMDLQMPILDGFEATRIIRDDFKNETPIIAFTANALNSEKETCLSIGMNDYLTKPIQPDHLYNAILKLLQGNGKLKEIDLAS